MITGASIWYIAAEFAQYFKQFIVKHGFDKEAKRIRGYNKIKKRINGILWILLFFKLQIDDLERLIEMGHN